MRKRKPQSRHKRIPKTFPCRCGHAKSFHDHVGAPIFEEWCNGDGLNTKYYSSLCDCNKYISDNLKYLEQQSKKRGKK